MIRFILVVLIVLLYLIVGIPILLIEWLIGKINPRARDISSLRMVQGFQIYFVGNRCEDRLYWS